MLQSMIAALIAVLLQRFPKDVVKGILDKLLDEIEDMVAASPNQYDDMIVTPLIKALRDYFDIPDNDPLVQ
jgi:hypothetical protein